MGFKSHASLFASSVALRSFLAGCLAFAFLKVLADTSYYATAVSLGGLALFTVWSARRLETAPPNPEQFSSPWQRHHLQEMERAAALLDAVTVALIAIKESGHISFANRAARRLGGGAVGALADMDVLGSGVASEIRSLPNGARRILTLADGRLALVWTVGLTVPRESPQTLISLQIVAGELDAVQLRAWQDMTRVLAHEIMNSLTPIASLSESAAALIESSNASPGAISDAITAISRRSLHLMDFVERYRQVADLPEPRLRPIRAEDLSAELEAIMQPDLAARSIAFASILEPRELTFSGDPELISQALLNLLRNAAEAVSTVSGPAIQLSCKQTGADIVWSVADNGPGVDADRLQEIFVPFFTTKAAGSGIGLTLARQVALAHGGRLDFLNESPGALLKLTIPGGRELPAAVEPTPALSGS